MTKLTDLDTILLSGAAKRDSGSLLPVPESVSGAGARLTKAITGLIKHGLAEERETRDKAAVRRTEAEVAYGVFITDAGNAAIGIAAGNDDDGAGKVAASVQPDTQQLRAVGWRSFSADYVSMLSAAPATATATLPPRKVVI
jgi:hypothetical protein